MPSEAVRGETRAGNSFQRVSTLLSGPTPQSDRTTSSSSSDFPPPPTDSDLQLPHLLRDRRHNCAHCATPGRVRWPGGEGVGLACRGRGRCVPSVEVGTHTDWRGTIAVRRCVEGGFAQMLDGRHGPCPGRVCRDNFFDKWLDFGRGHVEDKSR